MGQYVELRRSRRYGEVVLRYRIMGDGKTMVLTSIEYVDGDGRRVRVRRDREPEAFRRLVRELNGELREDVEHGVLRVSEVHQTG